MDISLITLVIIVLGMAVAVQLVCDRFRVPAIVGFLLTGLLVGPGGFRLIAHSDETLADLGVVLLLFTIGAEFSFKRLAQMRRYVLLGGAFQVIVTIAVVVGLLLWFGMKGNQAVFFGYMVSMSSTAILFRILQQRGEVESPHGRLSIGVSIFQDLASVVMMLSLPMLAAMGTAAGAAPGANHTSAWTAVLKVLLQAAGVLGLVWLMARFVVPNLMRRIARTRSRELFLLATLFICLGVPCLTGLIGLPTGIGAFLAGLVIAETEYSHQALAGVMPFKDVFSAVFFISMGMLLDPKVLAAYPLTIVGLSMAVLLVKLGICALGALLLGFPLRTALLTGILVADMGEFTFVIAAVGLGLGLMGHDQYQIVIAISVVTMAATPLLMKYVVRAAEAVHALPTRTQIGARIRHGTLGQQFAPEEGLCDHLVVIGFGVIGHNVVRAARRAKLPFVVIEMNHETARHERAKGMPILAGDATQDSLLESAHVKQAALVVVAVPDPGEVRKIVKAARLLAPGVQIMARTRYAGQVEELKRIGADVVVPDEYEAAVAIIEMTLRRFLIPEGEIEHEIRDLRAASYEVLRDPDAGKLEMEHLTKAREDLDLTSVRVTEDSALAGKTLIELDLRRKYGVTLLAIRRGAALISNPGGDECVEVEDVLVIYGNRAAAEGIGL